MYRENSLKKHLRQEKVVYGAINALGSPAAAEMIGMAGYDFVFVDGEHGPGDHQNHLRVLQAVGSTPATSVYRVENNDPTAIKRALDLGVEAIMVPSVSSASEARAAVAACFYPPKGIRGFAAGVVRASDYGLSVGRYLSDGGSQLLVSVVIETAEGVRNAAEIAGVEGVDVVQIGPGDLSYDIGVPARYDDPKYVSAQTAVERAVLEQGKVLGGVQVPGIALDDLLERGYRMIILGADVVCLGSGLTAMLAAVPRR